MKYDPKIKPETFVSKDSTRPWLTYVQLDTVHKALVATDGHRMIVTPIDEVEHDHTGPLAPEVLAAARKTAKQHGPTLSANGHVELPNGQHFKRETTDTAFPPWQNVMESSLRSDVTAKVGVNARYLASVFAAVGDRQVTMVVRGEFDPIEFRVDGELGETIMLIMPCRL